MAQKEIMVALERDFSLFVCLFPFSYVMCGYPNGNLDFTVECLLAMQRGGAQGIELGYVI